MPAQLAEGLQEEEEEQEKEEEPGSVSPGRFCLKGTALMRLKMDPILSSCWLWKGSGGGDSVSSQSSSSSLSPRSARIPSSSSLPDAFVSPSTELDNFTPPSKEEQLEGEPALSIFALRSEGGVTHSVGGGGDVAVGDPAGRERRFDLIGKNSKLLFPIQSNSEVACVYYLRRRRLVLSRVQIRILLLFSVADTSTPLLPPPPPPPPPPENRPERGTGPNESTTSSPADG